MIVEITLEESFVIHRDCSLDHNQVYIMKMTELLKTPSISMDIVSNAAVFAVMGTTGSGKSTFIQKATGSPDIVVGHNLNACEKTL
jgi:ABC-type phosphate transport system ATPase subunit